MELPDQFDVLVVGTGLTESIVAAASSRAGKAVLHLDSQSYYGSEWTSLNFRQVDTWIKTETDNSKSLFSNIDCMELFSETWTRAELDRLGNKISIDLCPRVRGSNVSHSLRICLPVLILNGTNGRVVDQVEH